MRTLIKTLLIALLMWCVTTAPLRAGAWPRDKGQLFVAAGGNFLLSDGARLPVHYDPTLYLEYGWTDQVTLGGGLYLADAGRKLSGSLFASFPIWSEGNDKVAGKLGFGASYKELKFDSTYLLGGVSWGRGLDNGWLAVDASAQLENSQHVFRPKLDLTWGHHWSDDWTSSLQLHTGQGLSGDIYAKVSSSITYNLRDDVKLHLSAVQGLTGDRGTALKFETWLTF